VKQFVRAYEPTDEAPYYSRKVQTLPRVVLVFDTETTTDLQQSLRVGAYQLRVDGKLTSRGVFYPGPELTAFQALLVRTLKRSDAVVIGFNLPFDVARVACKYGRAKGQFLGGFSFTLSEGSDVRIRIKHIGGQKSLFGLTGRPRPCGSLLDVATFGRALTGRTHSLASLAVALDTHTRKREATHGGEITKAYLAYLRADVQVTWECYTALVELWTSYGLQYTHISKVFSEASIGKAALKQMGIKPFRVQCPDFAPWPLAVALEAFYGGRSEVHIRREVVPVVYVDFLSMYPTVNTLMGLWRYVIARELIISDSTKRVTELVRDADLPRMLTKAGWQNLASFVRVKPAGSVLPVRADYAEGSQSIGLNRLTTSPLWYTLADVLACKVLTGEAPEILEAITIHPRGVQSGLQPLAVMGRAAHTIDPYREDFYKRLIELRATTKDDERTALKLVANSTCYGIFAELNEQPNETGHHTYITGEGEFRRSRSRAAELPGVYFNPMLAALITGAARLMLATLERQVYDAGLDWLLVDTDSMCITCVDASSVDSIRNIVANYSALNPYRKPTKNILKVEYGLDGPPVYAYAISAKRYALCTFGDRGLTGGSKPPRAEIVKASAHGLGHLRPPDGSKGHVGGAPAWLAPVWEEFIVSDGLHKRPPRLRERSLQAPAMTQFTVTGANVERYGMQPYSFASIFQVQLICAQPNTGSAIAPYNQNAREAAKQAVMIGTGEPIWDRSYLASYKDCLELYYGHPETKFSDDWDARGPLDRRHVEPDRLEYIGKESTSLEERELGIEPPTPSAYSPNKRTPCNKPIRLLGTGGKGWRNEGR